MRVNRGFSFRTRSQSISAPKKKKKYLNVDSVNSVMNNLIIRFRNKLSEPNGEALATLLFVVVRLKSLCRDESFSGKPENSL